jgi:hypothetical protein
MKCLKSRVLFATVGLLALAWGVVAAQGILVPPAAKQASVNGADLGYLEQGKGVTVVFVHGAIADHRAWENQREASRSTTGISH